jgi:2-polyprenyl-3-methyl-5-hydroxy-6-metoxy-1,4-benzoquinol methylase
MSAARAQSSNERKYETRSLAQRWLIGRFQAAVCELVAPLRPATALDAGCGEGYLDRVLLDRIPGLDLTGVDASEDALAAARARCPEATFRRCRVEDLADEPGRYDLVICSEVLEHLEDPVAALRELARLTGGHALLTVPWEPLFQIANLMRGKYLPTLGNHPEHIHRWSVRAAVRLVRCAFVPLRVERRFPWTIVLGKPIG